HAAVTYDATSGLWKLYLNGALEASPAAIATGARTPRSDSIEPAAIGTGITSAVGNPPTNPASTPGGFFDGQVEEVRIWNVVRTQAQIQADRFNELASGAGLVARWGFNETS